MLSSLLLALTLSFVPAAQAADPAAGVPHPAEVAGDDVLVELASGQAAAAVRRLRRLLAATEVEAERQALQCILGQAQARAGDHAGAVATLAKVPLTAACGPRAAFDRGDSLAALGRQDEAAAVYQAAGADALGDGRDAAAADALLALAQRILNDDEQPDSLVHQVLPMVLAMSLPLDRRVTVAEQLGEQLWADDLAGSYVDRNAVDVAAQTLLERLRAASGPEAQELSSEAAARLRRLAARLHRNEALLAPLPDDAATRLARADVVYRMDPARGAELMARALELDEDNRVLRDRLAQLLTEEGLLSQAQPHLELLAEGQDELAATALLGLARAALVREPAADTGQAVLTDWLLRFPAGRQRAQVEALLATTRLEAARRALAETPDLAMVAYDNFVAGHPTHHAVSMAVWEAGVAAQAAGQSDAARNRWEELLAQRPNSPGATLALRSLARQRAIEKDELDATLAWLRTVAGEGGPLASAAMEEATRLTEVSLAVEVSGRLDPKRPVVRVHARNLSQVEVRLHRIDAEAFLRAGGTPDRLPDLDVAVIAPDRQWQATLPETPRGQDLAFDLPLKVPGPGLYAVTVATSEREAHAVALVGDTTLLGRVRGSDLVVGVLRGQDSLRPAARVRVLVAHGDQVDEVRTGADGLARLQLPEAGAVILADGPGGPALLSLHREAPTPASTDVVADIEVDRPLYLPGDRVGFRLMGRQGQAPLAGTWAVWLESGGLAHPELSVTADARGIGLGELSLPAWAGVSHYQLMARAPGSQTAILLTNVRVQAQGSSGRSVQVHQSEDGGQVVVREADGRPAVDVPVRVSLGLGREQELARTDAAGRVQVAGPGVGVPWSLTAELPGVAGAARPIPLAERTDALALRVAQDRPAADEAVVVDLTGNGPVVLSVWSAVESPTVPEQPEDPWSWSLEERFDGQQVWSGERPDAQAPAGWVLHSRQELDLDGQASLDLGALTAGRWRIGAVPLQPGSTSVDLPLHVAAPGPRLGAVAADLAGGTRVDLPVTGPALVTAEGQGIEAAALVATSGRLRLDVPWREGRLGLVATGARSLAAPEHDVPVHARSVTVRASLDVALDVMERDGRWEITAQVTGPDGRPAAAQVALSALDERLLVVATPHRLQAQHMWPTQGSASAGGVTRDLRHAAWAQAISSALLAESARLAEAQRAASAMTGKLSAGRLDEMMLEAPVISGGLGTRGRGSGGGGSGYGQGLGALDRSARKQVGPSRLWPTGAVRQRVLWEVVETDSQGQVRVVVDRAPPATFSVQATAVSDHALGHAELRHDAGARAFLALAPIGSGGPEDRLEPRVAVVNGSDQTLTASLETGVGTPVALSLPPGHAQLVPLGELVPGQSLALRLVGPEGTRVLDETRVAPGVVTGTADPEGRLLRVAVGPGGGLPLEALAGEVDPGALSDVGRAARAGRAALAGARVLSGGAQVRLLDKARVHVAAVRTQGARAGSALDQADVLVLLADADAALPELSVPRGELDAAATYLEGLASSSEDRVAQLWALAVTGRDVDETRLGRLMRDAAALDDETRARLARALIALGRGEEAPALISGEGPQAWAARRQLGLAVAATPPPPPVGHVDRVAWLSAVAQQPGRRRGTVTVSVDGETLGSLDLNKGGELRAVVPRGASVVVDNAPGAMVQRSDLLEGSVAVRAVRSPVGVDGMPVGAEVPLAADCGGAQTPCTLAVGDALRFDAHLTVGSQLSSGLRLDQGLRSSHPGRFVVTGLEVFVDGERQLAAPLHVHVLADPAGPLTAAAALALAEQSAAAGEDPLPLLAPWPGFDDWHGALRPRVLRLRFDAAIQSGDGVIAAFEALRDGAPEASLALDDVATVARAYAAAGRPERAVSVWRAGLGAAFLAEAGPVRQVENIAGRLVSLQLMRQLTLRYPSVPVVDEAEFHLPERLAALVDEGIPAQLTEEGITATDVRLLAAAWDREFLALHPDSPLAPQAGFHLVQGLLRLRAFQAAAEWADRVADASPDAPVLDGLRYVEGLARSEMGQDAQAGRILDQLATGQWPQEDGSLGPAGLRPDARYALGRLAEARGDLGAARTAYDEVRHQFSEAERALTALTRVVLAPDPLVVLTPGQSAALPLRVANVDTVHLRAYPLDLRTVFLRDGGLDSAATIQVSGVSPAWSGRRQLDDDPFPRQDELTLPLSGAGAWLVQLDAEGLEATSLVVRSALTLSAEDGQGGRRLVVRRDGAPAAGASVRALDSNGQVMATSTDLRGVAMVPTGARALVFQDEHVAFTDPLEVPGDNTWYDFEDVGVEGELMMNVDQRVKKQRQRNEVNFQEQYAPAAAAEINANML